MCGAEAPLCNVTKPRLFYLLGALSKNDHRGGRTVPLNRPCRHGLHPLPHENSLKQHFRRKPVECGKLNEMQKWHGNCRAFASSMQKYSTATRTPNGHTKEAIPWQTGILGKPWTRCVGSSTEC